LPPTIAATSERYQPVHLLKIAAVLLFRLDDADVHAAIVRQRS
jgi:hypothetical protein